MTITLAFGSGNGHILSHLGNRIDHFIGSNSLVVYHMFDTVNTCISKFPPLSSPLRTITRMYVCVCVCAFVSPNRGR